MSALQNATTLQNDSEIEEREKRLKQREADVEARERQFELYIKQERNKMEQENAQAHTSLLDQIRVELLSSQNGD